MIDASQLRTLIGNDVYDMISGEDGISLLDLPY